MRASEIREVTRRRIEIFAAAGDDWPFAASIKSVSQDTAQEYKGRAVLELIQNGHDAIGSGAPGRIHVLLDLAGDPALYVANDGEPFSSANFKALIAFGLSNKGAGEGIGNKGLGFRSVLGLSDHPEVYSREPDNPADRTFSGYSFRFPIAEEVASLTEDAQLGKRLDADVSPLDLPIPAEVEDPEVLRFASEGFATVIKLPLRDDVAAADARRQIHLLADAEAPILLFLTRIASLKLTIRSADKDVVPTTLSRSEEPTSLLEPDSKITEVDLLRDGISQGRYLLSRRQTSPQLLMKAIRKSVDARQVDPRWLDWDGEAWVGVAVPLGTREGTGTIYTFLPTQEPSPSKAHLNAPFFTRLARRELSLEVPLNEYLIGEIAATSLHLLRALRDGGSRETVAPLVVDLAAWSPAHSGYLNRACERAGTSLMTEKVIPVAGKATWSSLEEAFAWPTRLNELLVITPEVVANLGYPVLDPGVGPDRQKRLAELHRAVVGTGMEPGSDTLAGWVESLAAFMSSADDIGLDNWARFYDDLAIAFALAPASLRGRKIILDQESRLRPAMGSEDDDRRGPQLFFAPSAEEGDAATTLPEPLAARVAYTHPGIPWNVTDPVRRRRPGRSLLESNGLVREYRTDQLLAVVRDMLTRRPNDSVRAAALEFVFSIFPSLNGAQQASLAGIPFAVPTVAGGWHPASDTAFSQLWETDGGALLDRLLATTTDASPNLKALKGRVIADPADWPVPVSDRSTWVAFLRSIGVHDGLPVTRTAVEGGQGSHLAARYLAPRLGLAASVAQAWEEDVAERWGGGRHPYTLYRFSAAMTTLPGASEVEALGHETQETYARLLARGLMSWPPEVFEVKLSRPDRRVDQQDSHMWPTPVSTYLRHGVWLPVGGPDDDGDRSFARPGDTWLAVAGQLPRFVPQIRQPVRNLVSSEPALGRMKAAGIRLWDDPMYCGHVLRELPEFFDAGRVAAHDVASFKKQYKLAWDHLTENPESWPWRDEEAVVVVVTAQAGLRLLTLGAQMTLFVPDEDDQVKQAMFALTAQPLLVVDAERGPAVAGVLRSHGYDAVRTSDIPVAVLGDDQLITADPGRPALVAEDRPWVTTVVALVAELKAGPFTRHTEHSIRRLLERLRKIRLVRACSVRILFGEEEIEPPGQTKSFPIEDKNAPTLVSWGSEGSSVFEEMEQCAGSVASLIGQPQLAAELALVFTRLGRSFPEAVPADLDEKALAAALQVSEAQVRESLDGLRGPLFDLLDRVRVMLAYFGDADTVKNFDAMTRGIADEDAITAALAALEVLLPGPAADLVAACKEHPGLADLRDALNLNFARYNDALGMVDPPHPPLSHPDRHARAMAQFVEMHRSAILDRLREAYLPIALDRRNLAGYGEARNLDAIEADTSWLDLYAEPPDEIVAGRVSQWLKTHGAATDLACHTSMPDISELRSRNFAALDQVVEEADLGIRAWARKHAAVVPPGWNAPATMARSALEQSYLADFFELSPDQILKVVADALGWPDQMHRTLDLDALGLEPDDLLSRDEEDAEERRRRQHERTHLTVDGREIPVGTEHLRALADMTAAALTEELLAQPGNATLAHMPSHSAQRTRSQSVGGLVVAHLPSMSEEQRDAVGLIGEVIARGWLERHYASVEWLSGYRNIVLGDDVGSDTHGYDFRARRSQGRKLYFEVKTLAGDRSGFVEFELGETEVVAAQRLRDAYRILLVRSALDSASCQIVELPNPLGPRGAGRYTLVGRGLRYRCAPLACVLTSE